MEFVKIMLPNFLAAAVLIVVCCPFVRPTPLTLKNDEDYVLDKKKTLIYSVLFVASILIVFRIVPYILGIAVITISLLFLNKDSIKEVNYPLLATFCDSSIYSTILWYWARRRRNFLYAQRWAEKCPIMGHFGYIENYFSYIPRKSEICGYIQ